MYLASSDFFLYPPTPNAGEAHLHLQKGPNYLKLLALQTSYELRCQLHIRQDNLPAFATSISNAFKHSKHAFKKAETPGSFHDHVFEPGSIESKFVLLERDHILEARSSTH